MIKNDLKNDLKLKRFSFIKWIVPVLDSDWLSHVRSCCKLLYKLKNVLLGNHFVATPTVSEELHCLVEEYCFY